jgi:excisionase family DNA binding protein
MDDLLTTKQLQDLLQVDRITIYRMLNDGRLRGFKVGGQWRFSRDVIDRWLQQQQATLGVTELPKADDELQPSPETLPLPCFQAIQDIFAEAVGIGAVTTTIDGTRLTPIANSCEFCNLIQDSEVGRQRCKDSWQVAAAAHLNHGELPTRCHAGLRYALGGIEVQGQFVAAIHAGQYLAQPLVQDNAWSDRIAELASATGVPAPRLTQALACVPVLDQDRQQQVSRLLQRVAATFSEIGEERLNLLGRLKRIAEITAYP